ncbi:MAG: di-trans,poly-cis-decaprenylcistransferase [Candidatus Nomurabacteria bacterium]|jgi:undecaprenyl diphosphate synthase|nr:di-trans,poly-cis-decaprenylcistransferase [Candidatus Nomurabacteria bacterium]
MADGIPTHLGFIVDGNRRWAKERGLPTLEGHRKGMDLVEKVAEKCFKAGVRHASFYVFSTENWERSTEEVSYLMKMVTASVKRLVKRCLKNDVKLIILGSRNRLDEEIIDAIKMAESDTVECQGGTLGLCFNYGGRQEIIDAANAVEGKITEEKLSSALYHPEIPDLDMIVRTSGEQRISGFMLWRAAYSELLFVNKYWPEITMPDINSILKEYARRNRRFGK